MAEPKYFHAARAEVKFDGVKIANITGFSWGEQVQRRRVQLLGSTEADERVPVATDVNWSAQFVKTIKLDERQLGMVKGRKPEDLIKEEAVTIIAYDKGGTQSKPMATLVDCVYDGGNWSMPSGDVCTGTINGSGRRLLHASEK